MSGISKLGITLTSVFSFLLLALIFEVLYLFWRRRQTSRRNSNRIEPAIPPFAGLTLSSLPHTMLEVSDHSELLKLEAIYGPSRVLFTIKEEEREEVETELSSLSERMIGVSLGDHFSNNPQLHLARDSLEEHVIYMVGESDFDVEPPFLTPCASPPYYTPSSSPTRENK